MSARQKISRWVRGGLVAGALSLGAVAATNGDVDAWTTPVQTTWNYTCQWGGSSNNDVGRGYLFVNFFYRNCSWSLRYSPRLTVAVYDLDNPGWGVWSRRTYYEKGRFGDTLAGFVYATPGHRMLVDVYVQDYATGAITHKTMHITVGI